MSDNSVKLVCFDLGRVLVRICENWQHAGEVARLPIALPQLADSRKDNLREIVHAAEVGRVMVDEFCRKSGELFGVDPCHIRAVSDVYLRGCYPGVADLIDEIAAGGYQTACLSNTNDNHWRIMFANNDADYAPLLKLNYKFGSQLIGFRKPEPGIYEYVERAVGVPGRQILFFDDLQENIDAARARGWTAELILHDHDPLAQLRQHMRRLGVLDQPK